jgi:hypothetical protein
MDNYLIWAFIAILVIFIGICFLGGSPFREGFVPSNSVMMYSRSGKNSKITDITSKITITSGSTNTDYTASASPSNGKQTFTSASSGTAVYDITAKTITVTNGATTTIYTSSGSNPTQFSAPNGDTAKLTSTSTITVNPGNINYTSNEPALDPSNRYDLQNYTSSGYGTGVLAYVTGKPVFTVTDTNGTITVFNTNINPKPSDNNDNDNNDNNDNSNDNSYDNYNHYTGSSYPTIFYGPDGGTARIIQTGTDYIIVVTNKNGSTDIYYITNQKSGSVQSYTGPNGNTATIATGSGGKKILKITTSKGTVVAYNPDNTYNYNSQDQDMNQYDSSTTSTSTSTSTSGSDYNSAFTTANNGLGVNKNMIPPGQEDLYILKSQIVPPVCPSCPQPLLKCDDNKSDSNNSNNSNYSCGSNQQIPYEYKQVPDYSAMSANQMPMPVLNDFSTFGM